ncbi:hypothetical protein A3C20_02115 [Candidatus Kaiserbacteria bacterium RIFCSPHIGHO2_02_FULL_55_25]|uniref:Uncharacterized protein n=1 Tax=Candidatus Kaiserbacteria bacterium RIFCSPHIGHO2_02_FULL_55_25 TaxID=1798498 RepID=A0A1F6E4E6_9BACT|nr:MAG: hypothetical protein A3C20_02115 [Candidatus Kaiserbacteria bacterium RIFCSPHIGHO2_02_FULL_55_25]OGG77069.1 MAG: hypothetical protein A3F56_01690 [Candidatus Kaiserbacteria bacterium RIFCSPHIGHO2_12_FULL_55_13]
MIETIQNTSLLFNTLAGVANVILGGLNIYLFIQNRRERHSRLHRDINVKESELEALRLQHRQEREELEANYEGGVRESEFMRVDARTENDRRRFDRMWQRQRGEEEIAFAELGHLYELRDGQQGYFVQQESKIIKPWNAIRKFFKRL